MIVNSEKKKRFVSISKIEVFVIIAIVAIVISMAINIHIMNKNIEDAGGVKQVIINAGKEVKDIVKQINEDE